MPREAEPSLNEKQFFSKALSEGIRLDGRAFDQYRELEIDFGDEYGVTDVHLGKTRIQTCITSSITPPLTNHPYTGTLTLNLTLSPISTPIFSEPSVRQPLEAHITHALDILLRRSAALDMESLCLISGQKCWAMRADIHVLSHDGNLLDAASIGVLAALLHCKRDDAEVRGEEIIVFGRKEREGVGLSLLHWPIAVTFSFFGVADPGDGAREQEKQKQIVEVVDVTWLEEHIREGAVTIGMNRHGEICYVGKLGGMPVDAVKLLHCANVALVKAKELSAFITRRLEEDAKKRDKGGLEAELSAANARYNMKTI